MTDIAAIGSLIGLVITLALLTWQTRAVARQAEISNAIAASSTNYAAMAGLRDVQEQFIDYPELRAYFYEGKPCPRRWTTRVRVISLAELLADIIGSSIKATEMIPSSDSYDAWVAYCRYLLKTSPTFAAIVAEHPDWWPTVDQIARQSSTEAT